MANIAIVNYCNLKCPYCFADDMIKNDNLTMSLEDYTKLLDFILKNPMDKIGIIGGEPTLHPQFLEILKLTKEKCDQANNKHLPILFTNGIELQPFLPHLKDFNVLLNYNDPSRMTSIQKTKLFATLEEINKLGYFNNTLFLGCNIHLGCSNYDYIWDMVEKYSLKVIRCSVVSPGGIYGEWKAKKHEYFNLLKPVFLDFCQRAKELNCKLNMDCSYIPLCYFSEDEKKLINDVSERVKECNILCQSVVDFTTDLKVTSCFGSYNPIDFNKFSNTDSLKMYLFEKYNKKLAKANNQGKCKTCQLHQEGKCQGGCLAFASPV